MPFVFTPINVIMSTQEAHKLSEIDKMLLGEVEITTTTDGPVKVHKDEPSAPDGNGFNGAMGPDSMLDQKVNEIKSEDNKASRRALLPACLCTALRLPRPVLLLPSSALHVILRFINSVKFANVAELAYF